MAVLSTLAATSLRVAADLLVAEMGTASSWAWLVQTESVAIVGGLLLIYFLHSESNRTSLLIGAVLAGVLSFKLGPWAPLVPPSAELGTLGAPLIAAVLCALLLSPGPTARLIGRLRRSAVQSSEDYILVVDESGALLHASQAARAALPLPARSSKRFAKSKSIPKAFQELIDDPDREKGRLRTSDGRIFEAQTTALTQRTPWSRARGLLVRDVTSVYRNERRLVRLAHYDSLTGLANRRLFLETLARVLESASEESQHAALFYIDLDDFKAINDSLGHAAGDTLLKTLAERYRTHLKPEEVARFGIAADANLLVARLAGDEFAVIASRVPDAPAAGELAQWILEVTRRPLELTDRVIKPSASVGIALFPEDGCDVETLLRHADSALYVAKSRGRQRFAWYEATLDSKAERVRILEEGLRHALDRSEMRLHYQPKVDTLSGRLVGFEALLRWTSSELGDVGPAEFIPVAETRGLVTRLGTWCMDEACRQLRAWRDAGFELVPVAVNVSSAQFAESDLQRVVSDALRTHGVEPRHLELELTESLLLDEGNHVQTVLRDLRSIGIRIGLDDFGTGYSALTYLNRFQLDVLKMDRDLLRDIDTNPSALGIASAVVSMAHSLDLTVVAEGVDMIEQLPILRDMACDQIQGFLFAPALPALDVERFMHRVDEEAPTFEPGMVAPGRQPAPSKSAADDSDEPVLRDAAASGPASTAVKSSTPKDRGRVLLIDDRNGMLGPLALRLGNLGIDIHYATAIDEAHLFVAQEREAIRLIAVPPNMDLEATRRVRDALTQLTGEERRLIVIGERPDDETRTQIREAGVNWVLWAPYNDAEIRYVMKSAMALRRDLVDRREIRVPVDLIANIWSGNRREVAVVSSLSARGAFIELSAPLPKGNSLRIEMDLPGDRFRGFARVVHVNPDDPDRPDDPSGVGVTFYASDRDSERILRKAISELEARYLP
jgi:diguanylate cyclase (GGDEF)-like protein